MKADGGHVLQMYKAPPPRDQRDSDTAALCEVTSNTTLHKKWKNDSDTEEEARCVAFSPCRVLAGHMNVAPG